MKEEKTAVSKLDIDCAPVSWEYLDSVREERGMSVTQWADISGVPESTIRHMASEARKNGTVGTRWDTMYRICAAIGASIDKCAGLIEDGGATPDASKRIRALEELIAQKNTAVRDLEARNALLEGKAAGAVASVERMDGLLSGMQKDLIEARAKLEIAERVTLGMRYRVSVHQIISFLSLIAVVGVIIYVVRCAV